MTVPARLAVDAGLASYRRGIGNYVFCLTEQLSRLRGGAETIAYVRPTSAGDAATPSIGARVLGPRNYPIREQISLPLRCRWDRVDLLHCPANTCPLLLSRNLKLVVTIHDLMFMMPATRGWAGFDLYHASGAMYRRITARYASRRASSLIAVSQRSADDLQRYLGVPKERIDVIHSAPAPWFRRIDSAVARDLVRAVGIDGEFILALGGADPRKNTRGVIESFAELRKSCPRRLKLAIVGLPQKLATIFATQAERHGVRDEIIFAGFVHEQTLVALYNLAALFLYISFYEGFGLPLLEAMACGTPVIASNAGSVPEVAGDAAILVDPSDSDEIAHAIARIVVSADLRADLVHRGNNRVRRFSWERTARKTIEVYEKSLAA